MAFAGVRLAIYLAALERMSARELRATPLTRLQEETSQAQLENAEERLEWLAGQGVNAIHFDEPRFPALLREIPDPPAVLFFSGEADALLPRCVGLVGARRATQSGLSTAREMSAALAVRGITVVSGLALGIDSAAHVAALDADGSTVAVFGCGLRRVYPAVNRQLSERIRDSNGLLLSEYHPDQGPRKQFFPERNRIISGLCEAVIVIEAGEHSGSLITARMALEQGRDVLAVPGSIHTDRSRGCHRLIREGAGLLDSIDTLLEELGLPMEVGEPMTVSGEARRIWEILEIEPLPVDVLATRSSISLSEATLALVELELAGFVDGSSRGYSRRAQARAL
jgi:DNA processing protein